MKEYKVTYLLGDEEENRLAAPQEACSKKGSDIKDKKLLFQLIMMTGCKWDIDKKLSLAEWKEGLIDDKELVRRHDAQEKTV